MDAALLLQYTQYAVPVGIVLVCAILVFVFGFKKAEQPPFAQLSSSSDVDRKLGNKKRGKIRDKRATNGQVTNEKTSPAKKILTPKADVSKKNAPKVDDMDGKLKEQKQEDNKASMQKKDKNQQVTKTGKENKVEHVKNKKNLKNLIQEKPVDFDDGDWEQAYSRKDKKNKKKEDETPSKKNKKSLKRADLINEEVAKQKEQERPEIKDKTAKETVNKELKEKDSKEIILTTIPGEDATKEKDSAKDKDQSQVEKVEKEEKKPGKLKKAKKISEGDSTPISVPNTPKADNKPSERTLRKQTSDMETVVDKLEDAKHEQIQDKNIAVTDEIGDVWTEAKPPKKSKKKARKDN